MNICEGGGCERANCSYGDCIDQNVESSECVKGCEPRGKGQGCAREFCRDCRVKECKKDRGKSCPGCLKTIAS